MKAEWEFSTEGSRERAFQKGETARIQASPGWEREKGPERQLGVAGMYGQEQVARWGRSLRRRLRMTASEVCLVTMDNTELGTVL